MIVIQKQDTKEVVAASRRLTALIEELNIPKEHYRKVLYRMSKVEVGTSVEYGDYIYTKVKVL